MAPRGISWRRPYTSIYNDNYRYGTKLYSSTLSDIEKRYSDSLSRTHLRSDRPDVSLSTFAGSNLGSSPTPGGGGGESNPVNPSVSLPTSPTRDLTSASYHGSIFESMLSSALHSSYARDTPEEKTAEERRPVSREPDVPATPIRRVALEPEVPATPSRPVEKTRPTSLYDDAVLFTPMRKVTETKVTESASKRKEKIAKEPPPPTVASPQNGPTNVAYWKDQCRDLQTQVDILTQAMSDMSNKIKGELSHTKTKLNTEVADLHLSLEQSSQQSNDLQKALKKQANQLLELQTAYEDLQRHMQDSLEEVGGYQRRSQTLRKEMDRLRCEVEKTLERNKSAVSA